MVTVRYVGGSCDGWVIPDVADEFVAVEEREIIGMDRAEPYELYRRRGGPGAETFYEFVSRAARPVLVGQS